MDTGSLAEPAFKSPPSRTPAAEEWRRALSRIPTIFGRLVYLASLREPASGRYGHEVPTSPMGAEGAGRALDRSHHRLFSEWLAHSMAEQRRDLDEFLRAADAPRDIGHYDGLIPPAAREVERQLFLADLETLMELLRSKQGGAA